MSYGLLWIETLLACLLFLTMAIVVGQRRKTRTAKVLCALGALVPLVPLAALVVLTGTLRIVSGLWDSGLGWAIALLVCYLVGAIVLRVTARKKDGAGIPRGYSWPLARASTAWLVVVSLIVMTLWNLDLRAQVEIQALRAEAGALALSAALPQVPDSANAALVYAQAYERFTAATTPADKDVDYADLDPRSPAVQEYLQRQQKALEFIRRAADTPECRFDFDYGKPDMQKLLDEWPRYRKSIGLLAVAAKAEAAAGNADLAAADARRMFAVTEHVGSAPALIGGLSTLGSSTLACKAAEEVLPSVSTVEQLDRFGSPDLRALPRAFARCLRTEEALGLALFCDMAGGKDAPGHVMWLAYLREHIARYRDALQRAQRMAEQPYYQTAAERKQVEEQRGGDVLSESLTPSLLQPLGELARAQGHRASIAVACAATRYRLDHGEYPASSDLLVPGYLEAMPVDPFDGQPLRLKKLGDGSLAIYSVGADGKDDGGMVDSADQKGRSTDVGVRLKMPGKR